MFATAAHLQAERHGAAFEVLDVAGGFAALVTMRFKHALNVPRPASLAAELQPMLPTPGHGSYPSGHATESFALAHVLAALRQQRGKDLYFRTAARAAENRQVAGMHYPVDSAAGRALGTSLGHYLTHRFTGQSGVDGTSAVSAAAPAWNRHNYAAVANEQFVNSAPAIGVAGPIAALSAPPLLSWMWDEAVKSLNIAG